MQITKIICDLCRQEIDNRLEQSHFEYYLPFNTDRKTGEVNIQPRRHNLCENCANLIKETCECIKAEADLRG